jgi:hypothetical protein
MPKKRADHGDATAMQKVRNKVTGNRESALDVLRRGYTQRPRPEPVRLQKRRSR